MQGLESWNQFLKISTRFPGTQSVSLSTLNSLRGVEGQQLQQHRGQSPQRQTVNALVLRPLACFGQVSICSWHFLSVYDHENRGLVPSLSPPQTTLMGMLLYYKTVSVFPFKNILKEENTSSYWVSILCFTSVFISFIRSVNICWAVIMCRALPQTMAKQPWTKAVVPLARQRMSNGQKIHKHSGNFRQWESLSRK